MLGNARPGGLRRMVVVRVTGGSCPEISVRCRV
jgi:hypothetical protein